MLALHPHHPSKHKEENMSVSKFILGLAFTLFASGAVAQERPPYGQEIGLEMAKKIAEGAIAESKKNAWRMAVAIVDNHGFLVYYERMDDTQTASVWLAVDKAKTAATYRRPSKAFEDGVAKGRVALLGLTGAMPIEGGLPIMVGGKVIGAIGVSGMNSDQDAMAAAAGLKAAGL
jgi:glc operon protein GlcG